MLGQQNNISEYMVTCDLPEVLTNEFLGLIPEQRQMVNQLFETGVLTGYTLALDRSKLWITLIGSDEEDVMDTLANFPLMPYFQVDIHPLAFNNAARIVLPALSLN